ncbi:methyltransferase domain-containing protein [Paenibacillus mesophilus]|uniref:methyltransferase n=1 Tax=Paenibacillus mesophilus TaxID=2582849 RepID=UPI00110E0AA0|nr:methyltransferase [Paenibacillus mesophilus]TMV44464.1 methyltransferase domain-containing protein [Paenibacillus mesophilus]
MNIDKSLVRLHFDKHAHEYEQFASVQMEMAARLTASAVEAKRTSGGGQRPVRRILEIGCGTGRLTAMLAAAFPAARFACIDLSARMIGMAKRNLDQAQLGAAERVSFIEGDAEAILRGESRSIGAFGVLEQGGQQRRGFDLIVSNAAFQWFVAPRDTVKACLRLLQPGGGVFAFSTFGPGTFRQLHDSFAEAERLLGMAPVPHGQAFAGGDEWRDCFAGEAGTFHWSGDVVTEVSPDVRSFLHRVKRIGAGNAVAGGRRGVGGRKLLETMERIYADRFAAPGGGIEADYEIGYGLFVRD